ncbi:hypothetical protein [Paenibacillus sp. SN-8-1]|uniref:hypothetical protein n=1 Tax=Paenibacillus sp. SN-8-1 TaxID=3435409 RepID=UPI003D9A9C11
MEDEKQRLSIEAARLYYLSDKKQASGGNLNNQIRIKKRMIVDIAEHMYKILYNINF